MVTVTNTLSICLQRVPYLKLETAGETQAEFYFRGARGQAQRCEFGLCLALAFPRGPDRSMAERVRLAHDISLLLASSATTMEFGLQYDSKHWMFWKRFELNALETPEMIYPALDDMLSIMRFLYQNFFAVTAGTGARAPITGRFA